MVAPPPGRKPLLPATHTLVPKDLVRDDTGARPPWARPQGTIQISLQSLAPGPSQSKPLKDSGPAPEITLLSRPPHGKTTVFEIFFLPANKFSQEKTDIFNLLVSEFLSKTLT